VSASLEAVRRATRIELEAHAQAAIAPGGLKIMRLLVTADPERLTAHQIDLIADSLRRSRHGGPGGAAVVGGLRWSTSATSRDAAHESLFRRVWDRYRDLEGLDDPGSVATKLLSDGRIPLELYGSRWTFKRLHADAQAHLFSHLFVTQRGFAGGQLHLVDMRAYLFRVRLPFDDVFEWGDEARPGAKPTVRDEHAHEAMDRFGTDVGRLADGDVLLVNNAPASGIFHAVAPLRNIEPDRFERVYHRCRVVDGATSAPESVAVSGESHHASGPRGRS
jgi:hypothetical protein